MRTCFCFCGRVLGPGNYRESDWESNIRMLTGTIKADWIPVERLLPFLQWDMVSLLGCSGTKMLPPGALLGWEAATFGVSPQWFVIGWLVCRSLCPVNGVAWGFHVGSWPFTQCCWLWLSSPEEEVWCPEHMGRPRPAMATLEDNFCQIGGFIVQTTWHDGSLKGFSVPWTYLFLWKWRT